MSREADAPVRRRTLTILGRARFLVGAGLMLTLACSEDGPAENPAPGNTPVAGSAGESANDQGLGGGSSDDVAGAGGENAAAGSSSLAGEGGQGAAAMAGAAGDGSAFGDVVAGSGGAAGKSGAAGASGSSDGNAGSSAEGGAPGATGGEGGKSSEGGEGGEPGTPAPALPCNIVAILKARCTTCHGNPTSNFAPMPLTSYEDVAGYALAMQSAIEYGAMPPENAPPLDGTDADTLVAYLAQGVPPSGAPPCP